MDGQREARKRETADAQIEKGEKEKLLTRRLRKEKKMSI